LLRVSQSAVVGKGSSTRQGKSLVSEADQKCGLGEALTDTGPPPLPNPSLFWELAHK